MICANYHPGRDLHDTDQAVICLESRHIRHSQPHPGTHIDDTRGRCSQVKQVQVCPVPLIGNIKQPAFPPLHAEVDYCHRRPFRQRATRIRPIGLYNSGVNLARVIISIELALRDITPAERIESNQAFPHVLSKRQFGRLKNRSTPSRFTSAYR